MAPTPAVPPKRALPSKESALFKELLSQYEAHQHKKAQKTADQILKKFPEHGETLATKGLVVFQTGKKDEGLELIRKGIRLDLTSHIVWHVLGLAKKAEKDYEEAARSYTQALRYEKENINMLRDAANLHIQLRNFDALEEVRLAMLRLRPNLRQSWIGMALAYHLNGNLADARATLETYDTLLKNIPDYDVDHSEILLYHAQVLELLEDYTAALNFLDIKLSNRRIVDRHAALEARARLFSKLKRIDEADAAWRELIDLNPDSLEYYEWLLTTHGLEIATSSSEPTSRSCELLNGLLLKYPRSSPASRLLLRLSNGQDFRAHVARHLKDGFSRGVPSLFMDIKSILADGQKSHIIREIAEQSRTSTEERDDPTVFVWSSYFLAQLLSQLGDHDEALQVLNDLEQHTPTLPEICTLRAKILKRLGDIAGASDAMEEARQLDGQDRFLNWKVAKYLLRQDKCAEAQDILGLFTKKDALSPGADLEDMQCLLYLVEEGDAFRRLGQNGMALKRYKAVEKVFLDFEDDQFDFHGYALRKFTLNSYTDVLQWEDNVWEHEAYISAAVNASKIYVHLFDHPETAHSSEGKQSKKKNRRPPKDDEVKKGQENSAGSNPPPKDEDPTGQKLLTVTDPLEEATKLLRPLLHSKQKRGDVWAASFEIDLRRKRYLLACKALVHSHKVNSKDPDLHERTIRLVHTISLPDANLEDGLKVVVRSCLDSILPPDISLDVYNQQYLQQSPLNGEAIWACARAGLTLGSTEEEYLNSVSRIADPGVSLQLKTAIEIVLSVEKLQTSKNDAQSLVQKIAAKFPRANAFSHIQHKSHANGHMEEPADSVEILF